MQGVTGRQAHAHTHTTESPGLAIPADASPLLILLSLALPHKALLMPARGHTVIGVLHCADVKPENVTV